METMEDIKNVIKWILASALLIFAIWILQPYGLLFLGVASMIVAFLIVSSITEETKPIDWNKVWRDQDNKLNKQQFDHIKKRLDEVEKVSLANI